MKLAPSIVSLDKLIEDFKSAHPGKEPIAIMLGCQEFAAFEQWAKEYAVPAQGLPSYDEIPIIAVNEDSAMSIR